jgi:hypothetical protein
VAVRERLSVRSLGRKIHGFTLVARTAGPPGTVLRAVKRVISELDRTAVVEAKTMEDHLILAFFPSRTAALLLGILAGIGLIWQWLASTE